MELRKLFWRIGKLCSHAGSSFVSPAFAMVADRPGLAPAGVAAQKDVPAGHLPDAGRALSPSGVSVRDEEAVSAGRVGSPPLRDEWSVNGETTTSSPRRRPGFVSAVAQLYNQVVNGGSGALQGDVAVRFAQGGKTLHVHSVVMRTQTYFNQVRLTPPTARQVGTAVHPFDLENQPFLDTKFFFDIPSP